jgi:hypothetical protein
MKFGVNSGINYGIKLWVNSCINLEMNSDINSKINSEIYMNKLIATCETQHGLLTITHVYKGNELKSVLVKIKNKTIKLPRKMARFKNETIIKRVCFAVKAGME